MNVLLILYLFLAVSVGAVAASHRHQTGAPRSFYHYLQEKTRNVWHEIFDMKTQIQECCNQAGCMIDGQSHLHGSIFPAPDGCNSCWCSYGSVTCTNTTSCGQDIDESSYYHYKDVIAQGYCSSKATSNGFDLMSAVRRDCDPVEGIAETCDEICGNVTGFLPIIRDLNGPNSSIYLLRCNGALWAMMDHPVLAPNPGPGQSDAGLLNLVTISYDQCNATDCGANYCCCEAAVHVQK